MGKRSTIDDVARQAGLSVATVDRVLNGRRPVRPDTADRVVAAAEAVNYHASALLRQRADAAMPKRTFGFLLQKKSKFFYRQLAGELDTATRATRAVNGRAVVRFVDELSPDAIVRELEQLGDLADALCIVSIDHPHVSDAVGRLKARGIPVISFLSQLTAAEVVCHVGIDSRRAGRTAAWGLARCSSRTGALGILIGSHRYLSHDDREIGFRTYFRQHFPNFEILETVVYLDDSSVSESAARTLLARHPDLVGLYLIGGGVDGVLRALAEDPGRERRAFVCHEMTPQSRQGLIAGTIDMMVASPLRLLACQAVERLAAVALHPNAAMESAIVPFEIYTSENI